MRFAKAHRIFIHIIYRYIDERCGNEYPNEAEQHTQLGNEAHDDH